MDQNRYIISNGVVADGRGVFYYNGSVLVDSGRIASVGPLDDLEIEGLPVLDVGGRLILPGLVNMHHHLYSHFAPGLAPHGPSEGFVEVLEDLWWPLDASMDESSIYWSSLCGAMDSVRHGVTTFFDHHASMNLSEGVLDVIDRAVEKVGSRAVLCLEVSDRLGRERVKNQFEENVRFWSSHRNDTARKGMLGIHANMTLSDESMAFLGRQKPKEMSIHVHCGEGRPDYDFCVEKGYHGPIHRLDSFGLISPGSLLVHCIHLSERDYRILEEISPAVVTNPESNANNRVGRMDRGRIGRFLLGTDGMSGDMVASLRSAFLLDRQAPRLWEGLKDAFFDERYDYVRRFFPDLRGFEIGSAADVAVLDYVPLTPVSEDNLLGHLIFGAKGGNSFMTVVDGKILWHDGKFTDSDLNDVSLVSEARKAALNLHGRFEALDWNGHLR
ncbi:amidohydrolase [Dethiosulfovibrio peptidovorans DSM 11002]|uniref:Amidohydrolase n=1 Tax=Dethiosulfovibrio peptidovorans DSM 11002 TaxID=469381 RepID=D2Z8Q1_9BACT|nr:amidohydrolase family protein [Dethiosulfovibrio peptidovorans]EFC91848.1 amidohydrolase [Dethiosulfovibrio peptidovorans DSM 11002]